jgi:hypothetical protein
MIDTDNNVTHTLLRTAAYAKDNRLLPIGFDINTAAADIAVVGDAANDTNFTAGQDQVTYRVSVPNGSLTVTAELLYQALSYSFAKDLRQGPTDLVTRFMGMYDSSAKTPRLVSNLQTTVR